MTNLELAKLINEYTIFHYDRSDYREYEVSELATNLHSADLVNFHEPTNQIALWCAISTEKNQPLSTGPFIPGVSLSRFRARMVIDAPDLTVLREIWNRNTDSHGMIKRFILANKPKNDNENYNWMMSIILGKND